MSGGCTGGGLLGSILGIAGGNYGGYGGMMGRCGPGSIFHHWVCCDYNPYDCCVQLEVWVVFKKGRVSSQQSLCPPGLFQLTNSNGQTATCTPQIPCTCEQIKPGSLCQYSSSVSSYICCAATANQCGNNSPLVSANGQFMSCNVGSNTCGNGYTCMQGICCSNGISAACGGGNSNGTNQQCLTGQVMVNGVCQYQAKVGSHCQQGTTQCVQGATCMNSICQCTGNTIESNGQCVQNNGVSCAVGTVSSNGMCYPLSPPGKSCTSSIQCLDSSTCNGNTCQCPSNTNVVYGYCLPYTGGPCQQAQTLINNQCQYFSVVGEPCIANQQCVGGSTCQTNTCRCPQGFAALYGYCVSQNGGGGNGNCNSNQVYYNGQCYTKVGLGYACNANVPGMCTNNGICTGGFCQCPNGYYYQYSSQWCIPNGSTNPCPQNQIWTGSQCTCPQNQVIVNGQCMNTVPFGGSCMNTQQCQSGIQCINGACNCPSGTNFNGQTCVNNGGGGTNCASYQVLVNNQCLMRVSIGQQCQNQMQCIQNAQCNSVCQCTSPSSYNGQSCTQTPITCNSNSVYVQSMNQCMQLSQLNQFCNANEQCMGFSQCVGGTCQCTNGAQNNQGVCVNSNGGGGTSCASYQVLVNNQCLMRVSIGQQCQNQMQCIQNAQCNSVCQCTSPSSYNGQSCTQTPITCNSNSVYVQSMNQCMQLSQLNQFCNANEECMGFSQCVGGTCQCANGAQNNQGVCVNSNGGGGTNCASYQVLVNNQCMTKVSIGQQCQNQMQCPRNYVQSMNQCMQLSQLNQFCSVNEQCMGFSQCVGGTCQCTNGAQNNQGTCTSQSGTNPNPSQQYQCPSGTLVQQNNNAIFCGIGQSTCPSGSVCFFLQQQSVSVCCLNQNGGSNNQIPQNGKK
ncbi:hypothetical protein WR25_09099 isoform B [Diploscapter pachys]|uniref:EGF-like domain-containing protein n=2 Tax=Diploscapter pachys TaxID=2018661 RepID=A0A2A2LPA9_9BILA|nr:hypothetical protein WR25_09099 isoform B [Diploscapter pachys]